MIRALHPLMCALFKVQHVSFVIRLNMFHTSVNPALVTQTSRLFHRLAYKSRVSLFNPLVMENNQRGLLKQYGGWFCG